MIFHKSKNEKMTYGIVGLGRFGYALAMELAASGAELIVLDQDEEKIRELREITENAYIIANLDKKALMETGIQNCDVAVVCIGEHMDTSILVTLNLVSMNIPTVISKATSAEHGIILEKLGAEVVYPERDMAVRLASRLETSRMLDFVQLSEKINVSKMRISDQDVGRTVFELNLRSRFGLNIIAIENGGNVMEVIKPDYVFAENDILFLAGSKEGLLKLNDCAGN
ncbi:MAG: TrkA family potassium uptake protein [Lachnospiraceae bacterium]|nr:TrkA family potassium uptake protein [Lachnospiraceae bacterium]MDD3795830.1 TrkA family potassium uptake protein [Lachnospiraceae bacterium]